MTPGTVRIVQVCAVIVVGSGVMRWASSDCSRPAVHQFGQWRLRVNRGVLLVGLMAGIGFPFIGLIAALTTQFTSFLETAVLTAALCAFTIPGVWTLWNSLAQHIAFDIDGITLRRWGRAPVRLPWGQITAARFRGMPTALVLCAASGRVLPIALWLGGIEELLGEIERNVPATVYGNGLADARTFRAHFGRLR